MQEIIGDRVKKKKKKTEKSNLINGRNETYF